MKGFAVALGLPAVYAASANPIRKVVTLMQDMQKEIEAEGEKEEELYKKFNCYCTGNKESLVAATDSAAEEIEALASKLKAEKSEKTQVEQELKQAKRDRADAKQDLAKATEIRKKEKDTYEKEAGDARQNIESITAAVASLEKGSGAGFLQTNIQLVASLRKVVAISTSDAEDRQAVMSFLSQSGDYVPQSGQIIGILKNMKDTMDQSLGGIVSDEESAVAGFLDLKAAKSKEIQALTDAIESKTKRSGELAVSIVTAQNGHDDASSEVENNKKFLVNLEVTCSEKAKDMEQRTKTRQEEIAAISEAISVLNDDDALDIFKSAVPSPRSPAFLQTKARATPAKKAIEMIEKSMNSKSAALNLLSAAAVSKLKSSVGAKVDFSSVLKMIDDMVALLKKEQSDDEQHRNWCNQEFDTSDDEKKSLNQKIEQLVSSISELKDEIANVKSEIEHAKDRVVALDKSVAEATEQRKEEHAEYTQSVQLNEAAIQLIHKAKNRLQKFYNPDMYQAPKKRELSREDELVRAAGGEVDDSAAPQLIAGTTQTVFIQLHRQSNAGAPPPPPETFGAYQKKGGKSNSIMALMDMLTKELETDIQAAEHDEKTANKEYTELVADAQESRAQETKSITHHEGSKANLETLLEDTKRENIIKNDQLDQTKSYIAELHSSCDFITANFEIRRAARTQEIEGLKNAKAVLNGADYK